MTADSPMSYFVDSASPGLARWQEMERELLKSAEFTSAHLVTHAGKPDPAGIRSEAVLRAADAWGHVPVPWGLPHPNWGLLTYAVPLLPLNWRPMRRAPGGAVMPGAIDGLYQDLLVARASVVAYGESTSAGQAAARRLSAYAEALIAVCGDWERADANEHGRFLPAAGFPFQIDTIPSDVWSALGDEAEGCAFVGSEHALVCRGQHAELWDVRTRRLGRTFPVPPLAMHGVVNHHAVFDAGGTPLLLDVRTGEAAESAEVAVWGLVVQAGGAVVLQDCVRDAGVTLVEVGRSMARQVFSPDRRWVWVIADDGVGAVYDVRTGLLVALRDGARHGDGPHAIALDHENRWCWVNGAEVWRGDSCLGTLGEASAAAFNTEGTRLLIQRTPRMEIVEMTAGLPPV